MSEREEIVKTENLTKVYQGNILAVNKVSFSVAKGEIFGFLGPNGAGKTTTILMLITLLKPTSGKAWVNGFDIVTQQDWVRQSIGYVSQDIAVDEDLTGQENLALQAGFYHLDKKVAEERISEVLEMVNLTDRASELVSHYSGGMRKRLDIAAGLIHRPQILFLDEPTLGLDIQTRHHIWDYIEKLCREQEITIFLTTHYMEEADNLCDRVAIIDHGVIKAIGSPSQLKSELGGDLLLLKLAHSLSKEQEEVWEKLRELPFVDSISPVENGFYRLIIKDGEKTTPQIFTLLNQAGVSIESISLKRPTLDDVFLYHTGRALREEEGSKEAFRRTWMTLRRARKR